MRFKRVAALALAVLLSGLFVLAVILAVAGAPGNYLMAVIFSLVFIPIILFSMGLMARVLKPSGPPDPEDAEDSGTDAGTPAPQCKGPRVSRDAEHTDHTNQGTL